MKASVLFICFQNAARSQMAEALMNEYFPEEYAAESAGIEAGHLSPLAVQAMDEVGIDISAKRSKTVFELFQTGKVYAHVISLCDETTEGRCPLVVRSAERHHWEFPNPVLESGEQGQALERMREVRDMISDRIRSWHEEQCSKVD